MKTFTVIGVWENGEVWADHAQADDVFTAMKVATTEVSGRSGLQILGAVEGEHNLITPGDDNDTACFADDLHEEEE